MEDFDWFDEEEDIILPDTYWGELVLIKYVLVHIIKNPHQSKNQLRLLARQIKFWMHYRKIL